MSLFAKFEDGGTPLDLAPLEALIRKIASAIEAPDYLLPAFGRSVRNMELHVERDDEGYHWVQIDHVDEIERNTTKDLDELLFWIFSEMSHELVYEPKPTKEELEADPGLAERRIALLQRIREDWGTRYRRDWNAYVEKTSRFR